MNTPESRPFDHMGIRAEITEQLTTWPITHNDRYFSRLEHPSGEIAVSIDDGTVSVIEYTPGPAFLEKSRTTFEGITPASFPRLLAWIAASTPTE